MSGVNRYTDITPDGLEVWCTSPESGDPPVLTFGADPPIALPVPGLQLRVARDGSRAVYKGARAPHENHCLLVDRATRTWRSVGLIAGDNAAGFAPDGRLIYCDAPTSYRVEGEPTSRSMPLTSQGFLEVGADSVPVWTDTHLTTTVDGVVYGKSHAAGGWRTGLAWDGTNRILLRTPDGTVLAREVYTPWAPRVSGSGTVAVSLPGLFIAPADFGPFVVAPSVPILAPIDRPIWLAPGELSGVLRDTNIPARPIAVEWYVEGPGNAEVIWREADLARRADRTKPFLCIAEVAHAVTDEPCRGVIVHLGDDHAGWGTPIAAARAAAARLGVSVFAYRDTGASIASELDLLRTLGVDGLLPQVYFRPRGFEQESVVEAMTRVRRNLDACGPMLAGVVLGTYTAGVRPLADLLAFLAHAWNDFRARPALEWCCLWPGYWPNPGRGGPNEVAELRALVNGLAGAVSGTPARPGSGSPRPTPRPTPEPDPLPDLPSEEDDMRTTVPAEIYLLAPLGGVLSLDEHGIITTVSRVDANARFRAVPTGESDEYFLAGVHGRLHMNNEGAVGSSTPGADGPWERWRFIRGRAFVAKGAPSEVSQLLDAFDAGTGLPL